MDDVDKKALARLTTATRKAYDLARDVSSGLPRTPRTSYFGAGHDELDEAEHLLKAACYLSTASAGGDFIPARGQYIGHARSALKWLHQEIERRDEYRRKEWLAAAWIERIQALHIEVAELALLFPKEGAE